MKIAIAGYGQEGKVSLDYFQKKYPEAEIVVVDESESIGDLPSDVQSRLGKGAFSNLDGFDLVVRTAGLSPAKIKTDGKIWSATNEFFAESPAKIIGVTGTKGKGTTCSLVTEILREAGKTVHLVGNIGVPALELLSEIEPSDVVVYELSSFQLWDLETSPHVAGVLMIEPDHLDVHSDFEEYIQAKSQITSHQNSQDAVVYHPTNSYSARIASAGSGQKIKYATSDDGGVYVESNNFCVQDEIICSTDALKIVGAHNQENACAAISIALRFTSDYGAVERGLGNFTGLPHRLKFVAEKSGVKYYDDSIATTPGSALAAVKSFDEPKVLLLGGHDKGGDLTEVISTCSRLQVKVVAYGANRNDLAKLCNEYGVEHYVVDGDIVDVVNQASQVAEGGGVVILSPAAASFDMFANYKERGDLFSEAVRNLPEVD